MDTQTLYKFKAISSRKGLPFYISKNEQEFKNDPYEQYYQKVLPSIIHYFHPEINQQESYHILNEWLLKNIVKGRAQNMLDMGCGIGFHAGSMAQTYPDSTVIGLDYSYQMLRFATDYWINRKPMEMSWIERGFTLMKIQCPYEIYNLSFVLSKAEETPFKDESFDLITSNFLWDRMPSIEPFIKEVGRILKPQGIFLMTTPLNYNQKEHWEKYYPIEKVIDIFHQFHFDLISTPEILKISSPIDVHKNCVVYHAYALKFKKKGKN